MLFHSYEVNFENSVNKHLLHNQPLVLAVICTFLIQ